MKRGKKLLFIALIGLFAFFLAEPVALFSAERVSSIEPPDNGNDDEDNDNGEPITFEPSRPTTPLRVSITQDVDEVIKDFSLTGPRLFDQNRP